MRKRLTAVALAGTVGLGAVGAAAYPAFADSSTKQQPDQRPAFQDQRMAGIKAALKSLVDDKTLTQDQADKVAERLGRQPGLRAGGPFGDRRMMGPGMRGGGLLGVEGPKADEAAAKVLGLSVDDLREAIHDGSTLADLAKKQGKSVDELVGALVSVAKERLAENVKAGRLTQETADRIGKTLEQRVRAVVQNGRPELAMRGSVHQRGPGRVMRMDGEGPGEVPSANMAPAPVPQGDVAPFGEGALPQT